MFTPGLADVGGRPISDRPYQRDGVAAVVKGLADGGRGQLRSACGTGKTSMAMWAAERLAPVGGVVVIAVPSVGLVAQTIRMWRSYRADVDVVAVCSDSSILDDSGRGLGGDDSLGSVEDILEPTTTDPDVLAAWLCKPSSAGIKLVVGTHVSCHVLGEGLQKARLVADLLIVDEAHRTAGSVDKRTALLHDNDVLPAHRRLYMTATPRIFTTPGGGGADGLAHSMDDERVFGPVLFNYPFSQAIGDGYLADYRVAVIGVTKPELLAVLRTISEQRSSMASAGRWSDHTVMVQAAVARAAAELDLRSIIAFCPRVEQARLFADTFPDTVNALPPHLRPRRSLHATHINGTMKQAQRDIILTALVDPPNEGWTVVSNARCLSEGVDVPAVDSIAFTAPKHSPIDIVQAVGRALRLSGDKPSSATIVIPVLLTEGDADSGEGAHFGEFELLWRVLRALRAHDDTFASTLDTYRANGFNGANVLDRITLDLPENYRTPQFIEHLTIRLVEATTSKWWDNYAALVKYYEQHGHMRALRSAVVDGIKVGSWIAKTRIAYREGRLSVEQMAALDKLGFTADPHEAAWEKNLAALQEFHAIHGRLPEKKKAQSAPGDNLEPMLGYYKKLYRAGTLAPERAWALEALGVSWRMRSDDVADDMLKTLRAHYAEHGDILVPAKVLTPEGRDISAWLSQQRKRREAGTLPDFLREALDEWGFAWTEEESKWARTMRRLRAFHARNNNINLSMRMADGDPDTNVVHLLKFWRRLYRSGELPDHKVKGLESLGIDWDYDGSPQTQYHRAAAEYASAQGGLMVPKDFVTDSGLILGEWIHKQRKKYTRGKLAPDTVLFLESLDATWAKVEEPDSRWQRTITELEQHCRSVGGGANIVTSQVAANGWRVGSWVMRQRGAYRRGELSAGQVQDLIRLGIPLVIERKRAAPPPARRAPSESWDRHIAVLRAARARHGHLNFRAKEDLRAARLIIYLRIRRREGKLGAYQIRQLDDLGFPWDPAEARWFRYISAARRYHTEHGNLDTPGPAFVDTQQIALHNWLNQQRAARRAGILDPRIEAELDALGMQWETSAIAKAHQASLDQQWMDQFEKLKAFHTLHGHFRLPSRAGGDRELRSLRSWLTTQRGLYRGGNLRPDRVALLTTLGVRLHVHRSQAKRP